MTSNDDQYVKVSPMLRGLILAGLAKQDVDFDPSLYSEDGDWFSVEIDDEVYDVNLWCDPEGGFHITGYFTQYDDKGNLTLNGSKFFIVARSLNRRAIC